MYSKEHLSFLACHADRLPFVRGMFRGSGRGGRDAARRIDCSRAYWTPPLPPRAAFELEQGQIGRLGLAPLVSLTDHDDASACLALQVTAAPGEIPISTEWTVPWGGSIFHIGVHNLPANDAQAWMTLMQSYTARPEAPRLADIFAALDSRRNILVVLNHPFWMETGIGERAHAEALEAFLPAFGAWLHALEINGTRPGKENRDALSLAERWGLPVISGGDRHACEPGAVLNLTRARSFAEFVAEIRADRASTLLFMPQYREPLFSRYLEAVWQSVRDYPEYPGRERWTDRCFHQTEAGEWRTFSEFWRSGGPWTARNLPGIVRLLAHRRVQLAARFALGEGGGAMPM
jgi:hypothetical protein